MYVEAIGGFLVSPGAAGRSGLLKKVGGRLEPADLAALLQDPGAVPTVDGQAVVDLAAAERWLARRSYRRTPGAVSGPADAAVPVAEETVAPDAVVNLDAVDQWLGRRRKSRNRAG